MNQNRDYGNIPRGPHQGDPKGPYYFNGVRIGSKQGPRAQAQNVLNDSLNQRDHSVDILKDYVDPKRTAMREDYKHYVSDLNNSFKNKKSRLDIEKEKQTHGYHEVGIAQQIYNSKTYADYQQKQYIRNVSSSHTHNRESSQGYSPPQIPNNKAKALGLDQSPLSKNGQMIINNDHSHHKFLQHPQYSSQLQSQPSSFQMQPQMMYGQQNQQQQQYNQQQIPVQPIQSQQYLTNFVPSTVQQQQSVIPQIPPNQLQLQPSQQDMMIIDQQQQQQQQIHIHDNYHTPQVQQFSNPKTQDLSGSMGPPSGMINMPHNNMNDSFVLDPNFRPTDSFKNPWTTIPRPMNGFMELTDIQYERYEKEKQDLSKVLQEQIEEKKRREQEEKRKKLLEEQYYEQKLAKDRMELAMREKFERDVAQDKVKRAQALNQQLIETRKEPRADIKSPPVEIKQEVIQTPQHLTKKSEVIEQKQVIVQQTNSIDEQKFQREIVDLQKTFKGELEGIRQIIKNQDTVLKSEVTRIIDHSRAKEQDKNQVVQEIQKLREEFIKQQEQKQEGQWDNISRGVHWLKYQAPSEEAKRELARDIKLKTILTHGYYGQDGQMKLKRLNQSYLTDSKKKENSEPLYQSSKLLNFNNFAINKADELQAEKVREVNIDRLKLLNQYEESQKLKKNLAYYKYSEHEEEELNNQLMTMDKRLYYMLNPETERIKMRQVPYVLNSAFDYYEGHQKENERMLLDGINTRAYQVE